jgi:hypothetical protein
MWRLPYSPIWILLMQAFNFFQKEPSGKQNTGLIPYAIYIA